MMVVESAGLSEPWFDELKNEGDAFLIGAGKKNIYGDESPALGTVLAHIGMRCIDWLIMRKM